MTTNKRPPHIIKEYVELNGHSMGMFIESVDEAHPVLLFLRGFIYSIVGKGSFIAEQNVDMIREKKRNAIEEQLAAVITNSREIGLSLDELQELLTLLYEE